MLDLLQKQDDGQEFLPSQTIAPTPKFLANGHWLSDNLTYRMGEKGLFGLASASAFV